MSMGKSQIIDIKDIKLIKEDGEVEEFLRKIAEKYQQYRNCSIS